MKHILVSDCLLGTACKYSGGSNLNEELTAFLRDLTERGEIRIFPVCPEVLGDLPVPRKPAEIFQGRVINEDGTDVTEQFDQGAEKVLSLALENHCQMAILKAKSPSCGEGIIYDGSFSGTLIPGDGVTVSRLKQKGIKIFTEKNYKEILNM